MVKLCPDFYPLFSIFVFASFQLLPTFTFAFYPFDFYTTFLSFSSLLLSSLSECCCCSSVSVCTCVCMCVYVCFNCYIFTLTISTGAKNKGANSLTV